MNNTHSNLSPSKRVRWAACPGSVREEARYPDTSNPAAVDGTHSHTLLEKCIIEGDRFASFYNHSAMTDESGQFRIDADRAERIQFALDYVYSRKIEVDGIVRAEKRVNPAKFFGRDDLSGTVDVQIIGNDVLEIIDYKDGMYPVDAKNNLQMELYAFGALADYPDIKTIRMTIIQPKLRLKGMSGISTHEQSVESLMAKIPKIIAEAAATDDPNAPLIPGDTQCHYCKHKGACSALASQMMATAGISFANLSEDAATTEPATMSDTKIKELIEAAPLIRKMLDGVEAEALRRLEAGQLIEGLKVVRGRGARGWVDDTLIAENLKKMGVPKDVIWKTSLISIAQIEKAKWIKRGTERHLSEEQVKIINEYVTYSSGKLKVVGLADPRSPVLVVSLFQPVSDVPSWLK